jgi:hypothetical protein
LLLDEPVLPQAPSSERALSEDLTASEPLALGEDFIRDLMPSETLAAEPSADAPVTDSVSDALLALPAPQTPADSTQAASPEFSGELAESVTDPPSDIEEQHVAAVADRAPVDATLASHEDGSPVAPDDDPGDLFESGMPEPSIALTPGPTDVDAVERVPLAERAVEAALPMPAPLASEPEALPLTPSQQSRSATAAPAPSQPVPRPSSNDPLGPVRALSEEETIALFS